MAEPSNKPRDIKNLKARLGAREHRSWVARCHARVAPGSGSLPPPNLGRSVPPPTMGNPLGGPAVNPLSGGPMGMPRNNSVPTPAFAQPRPAPHGMAPQQGMAPQMAAQPRAAAASPFDIAAPVAVTERKVRLVIDDSAVKEDEIGRKSNLRGIILSRWIEARSAAASCGKLPQRPQQSQGRSRRQGHHARVSEVGKTR